MIIVNRHDWSFEMPCSVYDEDDKGNTSSGNFKVNTFYKYLYRDSVVHLRRKHDVMKDDTGKYESSSCKRKVVLTKDNKVLHFESLTQTAKFLKCNVSSVCGCLQSKKKNT